MTAAKRASYVRCCVKSGTNSQIGGTVAGPVRRRIIAVIALIMGIGVVSGAASAQAAPATQSHPSHVSVKPADWWF